MLLLLGFVFIIFAQEKDTQLLLDDSIGTILTLAIPATLPIYIMVLMFDIVMVIVKVSSAETSYESSFFKKIMIFEIGLTTTIIYSWIPYFSAVFS
ncbi:hypothetical protein N9W73_00530 [Gammaproteobacteria bacterium]|nr:hypothetical protein [Gammaproteobacteria bacterium]